MNKHPALDQIDTDLTAAKPRRTLARRGPAPLALEPRVMFDGATADAAVAAAKAAADIPLAEPREVSLAGRQDLQVAAAVLPPEVQRQEIVFIEDNVDNFTQLVSGVKPGVEVVVLDHTRDGLQQMLAALDGHAPVDAIHLVTHGLQGQLDLGTARIDNASLDGFGAELARLGQALSADGDILIYGCDVAEGEAGAGFIGRLAALTGADIAASTDTTGAPVFGGDWTLEAHSGAVETASLAFPGYDGQLSVVTIGSVTTDNIVNNAEKTSVTISGTVSNSGQDVQVTVTDGSHTVTGVTPTTSSNWSVNLDLSSMNDGPLTLYVRQGNSGTASSSNADLTKSFTKDTTAPDTAIDSKPASTSDTSAAFTFSGSDNNSYQYMLDNSGNWIATGSSLNLSGLPETSHTLAVRALDAAGNTDASPASYSWTVQHTNSAPSASGTAVLAPVGQKATDPAGASVAALFQKNFSDVDHDALAGIAVTAYTPDATAGRWQYYDTAGAKWTDIGAVSSASSALAFTAADKLRFVPGGSFIGSAPALTVKLIESGATVATATPFDASNGGGASHVSSDAIRLTTSVKPSYSLTTADSQFATLLSGVKYDPVDDTQSNAADTDLVGDAATPLLLGGYDVESKTMYYRVRIGDPTLSKGVPVFTGVVLLGVDTDGDGKLDIFLGVDGRNSGLGVVTYAPGSDANISPSTTSITAQQSVNGASNRDYTYTLTGGNVGSDSKPDAWLTFKVPFQVLADRVAALKGGQLITPTSPLGFVLLTLTQNNSINGDIGGIGALSKAQSGMTWKDLGLLQPLNLSAPSLTDVGGNVQYVENASPVALAPAATFKDFDSTDFSGGKLEVTISGNFEAGRDQLGFASGSVSAAGGVLKVDGVQVGTYAFAANVLTVNFSGAGVSADQVAAVVRAVAFANGSDAPSTLNRTVQFKITDADANASAVSSVTVLVQAVNDAPTINGSATALNRAVVSKTVYTTSATTANALIVGQGVNSGLSVADVDAAGGQVSVTLGVDKGILQFYNNGTQTSTSVNVDGIIFTGSGTGALVMTGTAANINAFLAGTGAGATKVIYQPGLSASVPAVLSLSVNDQGNTGAGGAKTASMDVGTITIGQPAPTGTLAGSVVEDNAVVNASLKTTGDLSATISSISFVGNSNNAPALGALTGAGSKTWTYTVSNGHAMVQALADGRTIQESFQVTTADGVVYVRVTISGVNDAPTLTVTNASGGYVENGSAAALFAGATAAFGASESGQAFSSMTMSVANVFDGDQLLVDGSVIALDRGSSNILTAGGYRVSVVQGGAGATLVIGMTDASAAAVQSLVSGLAYQSSSENPTNYGANTSRTFTITSLQDNGKTANGGQDTAALNLSRTIAVTAVNDAPVLNTAPIVLNQDSSIKVDAGIISANDADNKTADLVYKVTGMPAKGTLLLNGQPLTGTTTFTQADIDAGRLAYTAGQFADAQLDSFVVQVSDGSATTSKTVGIDIIVTNAPPATEDRNVSTLEDVGYVFKTGDFPFRDPNTGDALSAVELYSLPAQGTLQVFDGKEWVAALEHQLVAAADIEAGKLRFQPAPNASNPPSAPYASFGFKVLDKKGEASSDAVMTVDVAAVNDAPEAADLAVTTPEDTPLAGSLPAAKDAEGDAFTYAKGSDGANGSVTVSADGKYTYTPKADFNGTDTFTYTVGDGKAVATYTVTVTVTPANDLPAGQDAAFTTPEDVAASGKLPTATDVDHDTIVYAKAGDPAHGSVVVDAQGNYTYTPDANYNGTDAFTYTIDDQQGGKRSYTVNVTVTPVNDAPLAADLDIVTPEDTAKAGQLPAATDAEGGAVKYALGSAPAHGAVVITETGGYTYTPSKDYNGPDAFTYTVGDGDKSSTYTVKITVEPSNDAPVAGNALAVTDEDTPVSGKLPAASDADGDKLEYALKTGAAKGTVTVDAAGNYTYTPSKDYNGPDSFTYTVSDGKESNTYTVTITVNPVNDAPLAADLDVATLEDTAKAGQLPAAIDAEGSAVKYALGSGPVHGAVVITETGAYTYTPSKDYNGPDVFTYTVSDGDKSSSYSVKITVEPVNDAPTAANTAIVTQEDTEKSGQLPQATDIDSTGIVYGLAGQAAHGTAEVKADGSYTYTPAAGYSGADVFTYTVSDGDKQNTYQVAVTVNGVNHAPAGADGHIVTLEDTAKQGQLPAATDVDQDTVVYAKGQDPAHGTVEVKADGSYTYTPAKDYAGTDSFTYTIDDQHGGVRSYTVTVDVTPVNDAPAAADAAIVTLEDTAKQGQLPAALDAEQDKLVYALGGQAAHGTAEVKADGSYTYTPDADYNGPDAFTYTVSDGDKTSTYKVEVAVTPVNDAPAAQDTAIDTLENTARSGTLPAGHDVDSTQLVYSQAEAPAHGKAVVNADGSYTYTPDTGYSGADSFTYRISDGDKSAVYTVSVTVAEGNRAPAASDDRVATPEDTALAGKLPQASDPDGDSLAYALASGPQHGKAVIDAKGNYRYTPDADFHGQDSFGYTVSDGSLSTGYTVTVDVTPVNDAPVAADLAIATLEDTAKEGKLPQAVDVDGPAVTYGKGSDPQHGTVNVGKDGSYVYTPAPDYNGTDSFTYTVSDGDKTNTYTVSIAVNPDGDAPAGQDGAIRTLEDVAVSGVLPAALDADGDAVGYALASNPAHGSVTIGADGRYTYTPAANYHGKDSFGYTVSDGKGGSNTYTVEVTVDPVNDAPAAGNAAISTREDNAVSGTLPNATDIDGDQVGYAAAGGAQHGTVGIGAGGSYTYTPDADYNGKDSFRYTVSDGKGGSNTYVVEVSVDPVNDAPVAHGGASGKGTVGEPMDPVQVPAFTDVDSPAITYTARLADGSPLPAWLTFDAATRSFSGTPPSGSIGSYAVSVSGSDGELSASTTVTIAVANPPAPGQLVSIASMTKDTGASSTDFVTSDGLAGRTVTGSLGAPLGRNEVLEVSFDGGASWNRAQVAGTGWSVVDAAAHGGNWTIEARVTNTVAQLSGVSATRDVVLDTVAPAAPQADDVSTTSTTPVLTGRATLQDGEKLQVTVDGTTYEVVPQGGVWTLDLAGGKPLNVGENYTVTAAITDLAGNTRSTTSTVSVSAPVVASAPAPAPAVAASPAPAPVEPSPVAQAEGSGVRTSTNSIVPGSTVGGDTVLFGSGQGTRASQDTPSLDLRSAELSDVYTRSEGFRTVVAKAEEPALVLFQGVPDQFVETGSNLSLTVPADAFAHTQPKAIVRLTAVQQDGRPLPGWVQFNGQTGQFTGVAPKGLQAELRIKLIARDFDGREATALFRINVGQNRALQDVKAPGGKPSLSQQLRAAPARTR